MLYWFNIHSSINLSLKFYMDYLFFFLMVYPLSLIAFCFGVSTEFSYQNIFWILGSHLYFF